jgi:type I restriction enzyme S subunit
VKTPIPKEWKHTKLGRVLPNSYKNGIYKSVDYYGNGTSILRINDFDNQGNLTSPDLQKLHLEENEIRLYSLKINDIVVNRVNSLTHIGKSILWEHVNITVVYESNMMRIEPDDKRIKPEFLIQLLHDQSSRNFFRRVAKRAVAQSSINQQDVKALPIYLPPLPEQKAIADLLSTWDQAIEKTEQLKAKKKKFYESQLSKHLSLNNQECIKLKKFLKEVSKRNRDLSITQVLSVTNSKGFVRPEDQFERQVASDNLSNYKIVSKGEYAYNPSRINVGSIARLDGWDFGVLSPMYTVFEIKNPSELYTDLFLHWLNSHEVKQRINLSAQGSVRETVSFDDFCSIGFPKIDFKKQKELAEYFNLISAEIDALKALSEKYKNQKRGLMQKMLTGEWRVKPEIVNQYMEE